MLKLMENGLEDSTMFFLATYDKAIAIFGPYTNEELAKQDGEKWQNANNNDPRWFIITSDEVLFYNRGYLEVDDA
jgi:hypothetical protein